VELRARTDVVNGQRVLAFDGVVDLSTLPVFRDRLMAHLDGDGDPVVDLDGLSALDDCGLGLLLGAAGRCREQGRELIVMTTSPRWLERLELTGMNRAVTVRRSLS